MSKGPPLGPKIGEGAGIATFVHAGDPGLVVKVAKGSGRHEWNRTTMGVWIRARDTELGRWLCPCVDIAEDGSWMTQLRVERLRYDDLHRIPPDIPDLLRREEGLDRGRASNWGQLPDGRVVVFDYVFLGDYVLMRFPDQYQDVRIAGRTVSRGYRECEDRYELIRSTIAGRLGDVSAPRGFTVLDVGAHFGYFSIRLAEDFGARCLAVDSEPHLATVVDRNPDLPVQYAIRRVYEPEHIEALGAFDVVLALAVLHYMDAPRMLDAFRDAARAFVIAEVRASERELLSRHGELLGALPKDRERPDGPLRSIYLVPGGGG